MDEWGKRKPRSGDECPRDYERRRARWFSIPQGKQTWELHVSGRTTFARSSGAAPNTLVHGHSPKTFATNQKNRLAPKAPRRGRRVHCRRLPRPGWAAEANQRAGCGYVRNSLEGARTSPSTTLHKDLRGRDWGREGGGCRAEATARHSPPDCQNERIPGTCGGQLRRLALEAAARLSRPAARRRLPSRARRPRSVEPGGARAEHALSRRRLQT